jgi:hypothetical protein
MSEMLKKLLSGSLIIRSLYKSEKQFKETDLLFTNTRFASLLKFKLNDKSEPNESAKQFLFRAFSTKCFVPIAAS